MMLHPSQCLRDQSSTCQKSIKIIVYSLLSSLKYLTIQLNIRYGLIIPNKAGAKPIDGVAKKPVKPCIFDEDEDMEEETKTPKGFDSMKLAAVKAKTSNNKLKKQTQIEIEKALMEDPSVFEYDNVYDEMEKERVKIDPSLKKNESKEVN